jgi:hypothetical protein
VTVCPLEAVFSLPVHAASGRMAIAPMMAATLRYPLFGFEIDT